MLRDFTLPLVSWFKGEQLSDTLQALLGADTCYEDLWVHCFAVTTNVTKSQPQVHRRGVVWRAVRASMSLLQLLPPMRTEDGELLIDGGYVSNLPVDAMRELYAPAVLIASDIENKEGSKFQRVVDFGDNLSGWWLMWRKIGQKFGVPLHFPPFSDLIGTLQYANHYRDCERVLEGGCLDVYSAS
jgi:lysophospholipid hydrolase